MTRTCHHCGNDIIKLKRMSVKYYETVIKYCSNECKHKARSKNEGGSYATIHQWRLKHRTKTGICTFCHQAKKTQWSNISGKYRRDDESDWQELCVKCHRIYDLTRKPTFKRKCDGCETIMETRHVLKRYCTQICNRHALKRQTA